MCFIKIMLEYCPSFSGPTFLVNPCNVTALKINTMVCYLSLKTAEFWKSTSDQIQIGGRPQISNY